MSNLIPRIQYQLKIQAKERWSFLLPLNIYSICNPEIKSTSLFHAKKKKKKSSPFLLCQGHAGSRTYISL